VLRHVCTALLAVLVVGGCSGGSGGSDSQEASTSPTSSPTEAVGSTPASSTPPVVPAPPGRTACYRLTTDQLTRPTNGSRPVPCDSPHTARTIHVGTLDTVVKGHSVAVDSAYVQRQLATTCPRELASYVGGSAKALDLSRFAVVWFSPTLAQSDQGADWFRCDLVAFSGTDSLFALPRKPPGVRGVLDRPGALDTYGLCGSAAPGDPGFQRVICGRPHSWKAFDTIGLPGGKRYPGADALRTAGDEECKSRAAARAEDTLKFRYGWEWPTREQWDTGQHFGYCWEPA
jgi:hypothetical protein